MLSLRRALFGLLLLAGLAPAQVAVYHQSNTHATPSSQTKPYLRLDNRGTISTDLSQTVIDYLIFEGVSPSSLVDDCWSLSQGACSDLTNEATSIPVQTEGTKQANLRVRLGFLRGTLAAGQILKIQWGLHVQGYQVLLNETDEWSFTSANWQWNAATKAAVSTSGIPGPGMRWMGAAADLPAKGKAGDVARSTARTGTFVHDGADWVLLADAGKVGPMGPQGPVGPQGPAADVTALQTQVGQLQQQLAAQAAQVAYLMSLHPNLISKSWEETRTACISSATARSRGRDGMTSASSAMGRPPTARRPSRSSTSATATPFPSVRSPLGSGPGGIWSVRPGGVTWYAAGALLMLHRSSGDARDVCCRPARLRETLKLVSSNFLLPAL